MSATVTELSAVQRSSALPRRLDRPPIGPGASVWWQSRLYRVDSVEFQGLGWSAVLVHNLDWGAAEARAWFAPVSELTVD
ncbi:MAG: hypothetical protein ACI81R_000077 [Bradymonadia bacterium]|jgi:hypothetical protein